MIVVLLCDSASVQITRYFDRPKAYHSINQIATTKGVWEERECRRRHAAIAEQGDGLTRCSGEISHLLHFRLIVRKVNAIGEHHSLRELIMLRWARLHEDTANELSVSLCSSQIRAVVPTMRRQRVFQGY